MKREMIEVGEVYFCGPPHTKGQSLLATVISTEPHFAVLDKKTKTLGEPLSEAPESLNDSQVLVEGVLVNVDKAAWPLYEPFEEKQAVIRYRFVKSPLASGE